MESPKDLACAEALQILEAGEISRGRGRLAMIAELVKARAGLDYHVTSIERMIRKIVRDWERDNPQK
jgi:hypothetical protein